MAIRKRTWTSGGQIKTAWVVDYFSPDPKTGERRRHLKTFETKKAATDWAAETHTEVKRGTHTAASVSITVRKAAEKWLETVEDNGRRRSTVDQYRQHVTLHINPLLGDKKLSDLRAQDVKAFAKALPGRASGRKGSNKAISHATARKVLTSLKSLLKEAQGNGDVAQNVASAVKITGNGDGQEAAARDIPTTDEIRALLGASEGRWRPLFITAAFTGLRASELRGLTWANVDLKRKVIRVRQRADNRAEIGEPKTKNSKRDVPMPDIVVNTLKAWKLECPRQGVKKDDDGNVIEPGLLVYVFPNGSGNVESHSNILHRGFHPAQISAGVTVDTGEMDEDGQPVMAAKYGLHALRHWYASWLINPKPVGLELPAKIVQHRMGHASIMITLDIYGHLFPEPDDHHQAISDAALAIVA